MEQIAFSSEFILSLQSSMFWKSNRGVMSGKAGKASTVPLIFLGTAISKIGYFITSIRTPRQSIILTVQIKIWMLTPLSK